MFWPTRGQVQTVFCYKDIIVIGLYVHVGIQISVYVSTYFMSFNFSAIHWKINSRSENTGVFFEDDACWI